MENLSEVTNEKLAILLKNKIDQYNESQNIQMDLLKAVQELRNEIDNIVKEIEKRNSKENK